MFSDVPSDNDDILETNRIHNARKTDEISVKKKIVTKAEVAKKILKKKVAANKKIIFDDEGKVKIVITMVY